MGRWAARPGVGGKNIWRICFSCVLKTFRFCLLAVLLLVVVVVVAALVLVLVLVLVVVLVVVVSWLRLSGLLPSGKLKRRRRTGVLVRCPDRVWKSGLAQAAADCLGG